MKRILTLCVALVAALSVSAAPRSEQQTPLYIVDGKAVSADEVKRIVATDIESMTVLRDEQQVARFSHFGDTSNGVIVICLPQAVQKSTAAADTKKLQNLFIRQINLPNCS